MVQDRELNPKEQRKPVPRERAQPQGQQPQNPQGQAQSGAPQPPHQTLAPIDPNLPTLVVDEGDTLWDIAQAVYADGSFWIELWNANRARVPNAHALRPGTVLVLPPLRDKPLHAEVPPPTEPLPVAPPNAKTHTVRAGETLIAIARAELGATTRWNDIWDLNRATLPDPNRLRPGQVLTLPQAHAAPAKPGEPEAKPQKSAPVPGQPSNVEPPMPQDRKKAVGKSPSERLAADLYNDKGPLIAAEAARIAIEPGVAAACMLTETGGRRQKSGRMAIRFEPHIFHKYTGKNVDDTHANQAAEWLAFEAAKAIDEPAAYKSISMGIAQVMGFNAERLGYADARQMFDAMAGAEDAQAKGFFEFIRTSQALHAAAQERNWPTFARLYNGPTYAQNAYDVKMATYYAAWQRVTAGLEAGPVRVV